MSETQTLATHAAAHATALERLIFSDAAEHTVTAADILILDDDSGVLTAWALAARLTAAATAKPGRVFVRQRSYAAAQQLWRTVQQLPRARQLLRLAGFDSAGEITHNTLDLQNFLTAHNFEGSLAIGKLPKSHGAVADIATAFAAYQQNRNAPATLLLGGAVKHMSRGFNDTLAASFKTVHGLRGKGKHRCLLATHPRSLATTAAAVPGGAAAALMPGCEPGSPAAAQLQLVGYGGVFSGAKPDRGGQLLAAAAVSWLHSAGAQKTRVLDLGCGNGSVSYRLLAGAEACKIAQLDATDIDADAVRSATVNLAAAAAAAAASTTNPDSIPHYTVSWDNAAARLPAASYDLVLLNPPFHDGTRVDMTMVLPLLDAAARLLRAGGTLLLVHNSHARYRTAVQQRFSQVQQLTRDTSFTVLRAIAQ